VQDRAGEGKRGQEREERGGEGRRGQERGGEGGPYLLACHSS